MDIVKIGVDILNPVQTSAGKMADFGGLKRRYGERLSFCGAIDTQHVLPNGTLDEVRAEVRRVIEALAPGGGFMARTSSRWSTRSSSTAAPPSGRSRPRRSRPAP